MGWGPCYTYDKGPFSLIMPCFTVVFKKPDQIVKVEK